jgi:hypothetical protein
MSIRRFFCRVRKRRRPASRNRNLCPSTRPGRDGRRVEKGTRGTSPVPAGTEYGRHGLILRRAGQADGHRSGRCLPCRVFPPHSVPAGTGDRAAFRFLPTFRPGWDGPYCVAGRCSPAGPLPGTAERCLIFSLCGKGQVDSAPCMAAGKKNLAR